MTRYQMLKLVQWAGTLHSRKRLQKVAYLLQAAGCSLEAEFFLDVIGPYSEDVRHRVDELVVLRLLEEQASGPRYQEQFSYCLSPVAKDFLTQLEQSEEGRLLMAEMTPFEPLAQALLQVEPVVLEVAGTLLYFQRQGRDWPQALEKTCTFKHILADSPLIFQAEKLARSVEVSMRQSAA